MISQEENEICYLCNETSYIGNIEYFCNEFDENGKEIYLCQNCYFSGKCNECNMTIHNINELIYLIDNLKSINTCTLCLLDKEKRINSSLNKINENNKKIIKILESSRNNTNTDTNIDYIDINEEIINYNLSIYNKKETQIPYYNQIINKCKYEKYTPKTENIVKTNTDKVSPSKEIRRSYVLYNFRKLVNKVIEINKEQFKINIINKRKINIINRIKDYLEKNKKLTFEEICNIPLPPVSYDEDILLNINIVNKKEIKDTPKNIKPRNKKQNTNQLKIIRNIIDKIVKTTNTVNNKNDELYNLLYNKNRNNIDIYSYIYTNENSLETVELVDGKIDKNNSRLKLICNIFDKIKNTPKIYNSEYIFNYYTFKQINNDGFEELIKELNVLCNNNKNIKIEDPTLESDNEIKCLNPCCLDNSDDANDFCDSCKNDLINCKKCSIKFWTDEDIKYCEDCN